MADRMSTWRNRSNSKKSALMPSGKNKVQNATLNRGRTSKYQKAQSTGNTHIALRNSTTKGKGRLGQHIYIYADKERRGNRWQDKAQKKNSKIKQERVDKHSNTQQLHTN